MNDDLDTKTDAELNELFAVEVAGWTPWFEKRGDGYIHLIWQRADENEPWTRQRDGERFKPNYTKGKAGDFDPMKHVDHLRLVFCTDANAVLPWLEKLDPKPTATMFPIPRKVGLWGWRIATNCASNPGMAESFARAAVIALIRSKRSATNTSP